MKLGIAKQSRLHFFFEIGVIFKFLFALLETIGGLLLYFASHDFFTTLILDMTMHELQEDPRDRLAFFLLNKTSSLFSSQHFFGFYLFLHGIVKLVLLIGLLKKKIWTYPASMIVFAAFCVYQIYRFSYSHSPWLLMLTAIDIGVIWLIGQEYKSINKNHAK